MVGWAAPWDQLWGMVRLGWEHVCCPVFVLGKSGHKEVGLRVPVWAEGGSSTHAEAVSE